jgi:hypothetical protein
MTDIARQRFSDNIGGSHARSESSSQTLSQRVQADFRPLTRAASEHQASLDLSLNDLYGSDQQCAPLVGHTASKGRTASEKILDFVNAASTNACHLENYTHYFHSEIDKLTGVAEGMNIAKEELKANAGASWNSFTHGGLVDFLSHANAINDPLFRAANTALDQITTGKLPHTIADAIAHGSAHYDKLSDREKGHLIGRVAFVSINPQGSTESAEALIKIADAVATNVDSVVMKTINQSVAAINHATPEVAEHIKKSLGEYISRHALTELQLESSGIPRGFFTQVESTSENGDSLLLMVQGDEERLVASEDSIAKVQWPVLNERPSADVVQQLDENSCASAIGEMLSKGKISQQELISKMGSPGFPEKLAPLLGPGWKGGYVGPAYLNDLLKRGSWGAEFKEYGRMGHMVVIDGLDNAGNFVIRDPAKATRYEMTRDDFLNMWTGRAVFD